MNDSHTGYFSDGVYCREITIPKDHAILGKIHKTRHLNVIMKGECFVATPIRVIKIKAPFVFESFEGEQKLIRAFSDTVWMTVHSTEHTDEQTIEDEITSEYPTEELFQMLQAKLEEQLCLS